MAFSDYKHISQVQQDFKITYREESFIRPAEILPSAAFLEEFTFNREYFDLYTSEGSRSELIILPVLSGQSRQKRGIETGIPFRPGRKNACL